jgi:hypothetical protein
MGLNVYRLVRSSPPTARDFASHKALGIATPGIDECRTRACSVFASLEAVDRLRLLPKFKDHRCVVKLHLNNHSGLVNSGKNGHYDWWLFRNFDPCQNSTVIREYG